MGPYTDRLNRRFTANRIAKNPPKLKRTGEYLVSAAIRRDGKIHGGFKSHAQVRTSLGDTDPYMSKRTDQEGFITSTGRFVDRSSARMIAIAAGQVPPSFNRELLSSDIDW